MQTEYQNKTLELYLHGYGNHQQDDQVLWLAIAEFAYNNSVYSSTCETPFFLAYGIHPLMPNGLQLSFEINISLVSGHTQSVVKIRSWLEKGWVENNAKGKKYYDAKHEAKTYKVGDKVWLSGRNILTDCSAKKLDYQYHEIFMIPRCICTQAY